MSTTLTQACPIDGCMERLRNGDDSARGDLLNLACERLVRMTRKMKRDFPGVVRWEQTDDVFQNAAIRLYDSLAHVELNDPRHFFRLAAVQIRRELIDLARHYGGPNGIGANHHTHRAAAACDESRAAVPAYEQAELTQDPGRLAEWGEMHEKISELPDEEQELFDLLWYQQLQQEQVAQMLEISVRQLKRRWRSAKVALCKRLKGTCPPL